MEAITRAQMEYWDTSEAGELKLLRALLSRAYYDASGSVSGSACQWVNIATRERREAIEWILSSSDLPWSFKWACAHLRLQPGTIQAIIDAADRFWDELEFGSMDEQYGT